MKIGDPQRPIRNEKGRFHQAHRRRAHTRGFDTYFGVDLPNFRPYTFIENDRVVAQPTADKPEKMFGWPGAMKPAWAGV